MSNSDEIDTDRCDESDSSPSVSNLATIADLQTSSIAANMAEAADLKASSIAANMAKAVDLQTSSIAADMAKAVDLQTSSIAADMAKAADLQTSSIAADLAKAADLQTSSIAVNMAKAADLQTSSIAADMAKAADLQTSSMAANLTRTIEINGITTPSVFLELTNIEDDYLFEQLTRELADSEYENRLTSTSSSHHQEFSWTYVDWINYSFQAAPIVSSHILEELGVDEINPRARKVFERIIGFSIFMYFTGDAVTSASLSMIGIEFIKLFTSREDD